MYNQWSLDILYKGADDPKLKDDMNKVESLVAEIKKMAPNLSKGDKKETIRKCIDIKEELSLTLNRIMSFFELRRTADASDAQGAAYMTKISALMTSVAKEEVIFEKYIGSIENLDEIIEKDDVLKEYKFYFHEIKQSVSHKMSDEAEEVFAKMNVSGGDAWGDLFSHLTSNVEVDYKGEKTTLSTIRSLAESSDKDERKSAYEAELACYDKIKDSIAFALNGIKAQVNTEAELRGYENPLAMTLEASRMQKSTLDAMFTAMRKYFPKFREYLRHKAKLLGYKNGLPFYELLAPMGSSVSKTYTVEEAHKYLVDHFNNFAEDLASMVDRAFKEEWIDFYPRAGKVGGAFCYNLPFVNQSRILTNFSGSFGSIVTLAHELGHAFHGQQIESHRPLNTDYSMPVAETASTFNELVIVNDAIAHSEGEEKVRLIEGQLQDCTQIILDIYSRFLFEDEVIRRRKDTFLFAKDLEEIMINAQKESYGDGLDPNYLHPYMWCCKSHYYSAGLSYYNFPYAFGGLFSRGLYAKYLEQGKDFLPKYRALLKATTVDTVENVAKIADIDLTKPEFWEESLQTVANQIDDFIKETSK